MSGISIPLALASFMVANSISGICSNFELGNLMIQFPFSPELDIEKASSIRAAENFICTPASENLRGGEVFVVLFAERLCEKNQVVPFGLGPALK